MTRNLCTCIHVCAYVSVCTCMCTRMYIHVGICACVQVSMCVRTWIHVCADLVHIYVYIYVRVVCIYACLCTFSVCIYVHVCVSACAHANMYLCMYVCMCVCVMCTCVNACVYSWILISTTHGNYWRVTLAGLDENSIYVSNLLLMYLALYSSFLVYMCLCMCLCMYKHVTVRRFDVMIDDLQKKARKGLSTTCPVWGWKGNSFTFRIAQYLLHCNYYVTKLVNTLVNKMQASLFIDTSYTYLFKVRIFWSRMVEELAKALQTPVAIIKAGWQLFSWVDTNTFLCALFAKERWSLLFIDCIQSMYIRTLSRGIALSLNVQCRERWLE